MNLSRITRNFFTSCCKRHSLYARYYSRGPAESNHPDSIFSGNSAWDNVFSNLDDYDANSSPSLSRPNVEPGGYTKDRGRQFNRRQAMTAREISAFDEMFNIILDAASNQEGAGTDGPHESFNLGDIFSSTRERSRGKRQVTNQEALLDRKKEEINLCTNDLELLHWTQREVLDAFDNLQGKSNDKMEDNKFNPADISSSTPLDIQTYSHLVALLMRTFRDNYNDPHLALALFNKVKHRSLSSYIFGCSTQVYNELIETRWEWFRDLRGVHDAVEEMVVNGVGIDNQTRKLVEMVRYGVRRRKAWVENMDVHNAEVWKLLLRLDNAIAKSSSQDEMASRWDQWKKESSSDEEWEFDNW